MSSRARLRVVTMVTPVAKAPNALRNGRVWIGASVVMARPRSKPLAVQRSWIDGSRLGRRVPQVRESYGDNSVGTGLKSRAIVKVFTAPTATFFTLYCKVQRRPAYRLEGRLLGRSMRIRLFGQYVHASIAALAAVEAAAFFGTLFLAYRIRFETWYPTAVESARDVLWPCATVFSAAVLLSLLAFGLYSSRQRARTAEIGRASCRERVERGGV